MFCAFFIEIVAFVHVLFWSYFSVFLYSGAHSLNFNLDPLSCFGFVLPAVRHRVGILAHARAGRIDAADVGRYQGSRGLRAAAAGCRR